MVESSKVSKIQKLVSVGIALSSEKRLDTLLDRIVAEAVSITHADGGALYIVDTSGRNLNFAIIQNKTLNVRLGGIGAPITWPPVPLFDDRGNPNRSHVSAYCALLRETVHIEDVYKAAGHNFDGTRVFDLASGYRSRSMLVVPMLNRDHEVLGVLQLVNAQDPDSGCVIPFPSEEIETIRSLASQAAVSLENVRLMDELRNLLDSFIQAVAHAIDEKSPFTGGHIKRVTDLAVALAGNISETTTGAFADIAFSPDQMEEIRIASWMHDVGKVSIPEYVVDKSTKLEALFDRVELLRHRVEILKRDAEIRHLKRLSRKTVDDQVPMPADSDLEAELSVLSDMCTFLEGVNIGGEHLSDDTCARIRQLAGFRYRLSSEEKPLLTEEEVEHLSVAKGTLTAGERAVVNRHAELTRRILESLPFPRKQRDIPRIASAHHEKLDGSGYPLGLRAEEIPIQARILAVADVFEALTAPDRPYQKGKRLCQAVEILELMARSGQLDEEVCGVLFTSGLASGYALKYLNPEQLTHFEWNGVTYFPDPSTREENR